MGALGGLLPDILRIAKSRHDPQLQPYLRSIMFWVGFLLAVTIGAVAAALAGADNVREALTYGSGRRRCSLEYCLRPLQPLDLRKGCRARARRAAHLGQLVGGVSGTSVRSVLLTCTLAVAAAATLPAQAVQAVAHQRVKGAITLDSAAKVLVDAWERFTALSREATDTGARMRQECADSVASAAKRALLATGDPRAFQMAWEDFDAAYRRYYRQCEDAGTPAPLRQQARAPAPVSPQVFDLVPAVVFTAGWALTDGTDMTTQHSFAVSTNLLGAAVGDLFQAIGAPDMKDYLSKNVAVGTSFPAGDGGRLTGFVQLGLGEVRLSLPILRRPVALWPALAVEQLDVADRRAPATLVTLDTARQAWTAPVLSLGLTFWSGQKLRERIERAEFTPVVSFGLMLPYYFPGDPFASLAALVTGRREKYEQAGRVRFSVGVGVPLLRPGTN